MVSRKPKEESFNKKLVEKILDVKGETYDEWLEEKHREFLKNKEHQGYVLKGLETYKEIGGE